MMMVPTGTHTAMAMMSPVVKPDFFDTAVGVTGEGGTTPEVTEIEEPEVMDTDRPVVRPESGPMLTLKTGNSLPKAVVGLAWIAASAC